MSPVEIEAQGTHNVFVPCSPLYIGHIFALILREYGKNVAIRAKQLAKLSKIRRLRRQLLLLV